MENAKREKKGRNNDITKKYFYPILRLSFTLFAERFESQRIKIAVFMRKLIVAVLIIICLLLASIYLFIPTTIIIQKDVEIKMNQQAMKRLIMDENNWHKWWPDEDSAVVNKDTKQPVLFNGNTYSITDIKYSSVLFTIQHKNDELATSSLDIIAISKDTVKLYWEAVIATSKNPITRLQQYLSSRQIKKDMSILLNKIETFFSKPYNIYGIDIREELVVDSLLLSTYDSVKNYPSTEFIYSLIDKLKKYIDARDATITGDPMLNIFTKDSITYLVKVALPVNKKLPASGNITYKWMLPGGKILVTDITGDSKNVDRASRQMLLFVNDYQKIAPAISFFSLVTNRMQEKDSTKWVTRIYFPIID